MNRRTVFGLSLCAVAAGVLGLGRPAAAEEPYRLSGPHVHANLAIFFLHGKNAPGPVPLTLEEGVAKGLVRVYETGSVNELQVENVSGEDVFIQSGDIVKGGKQDRVLMVSLILPPRSGRVPIASFCVEQGRWSARGGEDVSRFSSAGAALPSRKAKVAMKAPAKAEPENTGGPAEQLRSRIGRGDVHVRGTFGDVRRARANDTGTRQSEVWRSVAETQAALTSNVGAPVQAAQSRSSLQLTLENDKLKEMQAAYIKALQAAGESGDDIVGYVFAINGEINSADVYPSNGLFRKMWRKLLDASVTEAIGERRDAASPPPGEEAVRAFLAAAEAGETSRRDLTKGVSLETREGKAALYFSTQSSGGQWVHRNYLRK